MTLLNCDSPRENICILQVLIQIQVLRNKIMVLVSRDYTSEGLVAFLCSPGSLLMSVNASFRIAVSPNDLMGLLALP